MPTHTNVIRFPNLANNHPPEIAAKLRAFPTCAGIWEHVPDDCYIGIVKSYVVEEGVNGRLCRALKMGGSSRSVGYRDWSGHWNYVGPA